jgi:hypothetical protein
MKKETKKATKGAKKATAKKAESESTALTVIAETNNNAETETVDAETVECTTLVLCTAKKAKKESESEKKESANFRKAFKTEANSYGAAIRNMQAIASKGNKRAQKILAAFGLSTKSSAKEISTARAAIFAAYPFATAEGTLCRFRLLNTEESVFCGLNKKLFGVFEAAKSWGEILDESYISTVKGRAQAIIEPLTVERERGVISFVYAPLYCIDGAKVGKDYSREYTAYLCAKSDANKAAKNARAKAFEESTTNE